MSRRRVVRIAAIVGLAAIAVACVPITQPPPPQPTPTTKPPASNVPTLNRSAIVSVGGTPIWDVAFAGDGMYFTQRSGQIWIRRNNVNTSLGNVPGVTGGGEGGLLGMTTDPEWDQPAGANHFLYFCYSWDDPNSSATENRVAKWEVNSTFDGFVGSDPTVIVPGLPHNPGAGGRHSGCRPRFKPGTTDLWIGTGDAAMNGNPQSTTSLGGKILRVDRNGVALAGNFGGGFDARVYSYGHRNVQGLAFQAGGVAYSAEHGPGTDDEVNRLASPGDRGWHPVGPPNPYNEGVPMTAAGAIPAAWTSGSPTLAPSGIAFLSGAKWKSWNGALAVGMLKTSKLTIMKLNASGAVSSTTDTLALGIRLRSPVLGPDGNLYIATDTAEIWKVVPS